jgi:hypothetical protein
MIVFFRLLFLRPSAAALMLLAAAGYGFEHCGDRVLFSIILELPKYQELFCSRSFF